MLSISSNSLLFFYRVRAVYSNSTIITAFFGFLWVATSGLSVLCPFSIFADVSPFTAISRGKKTYPIPYPSSSLIAFIQHIGPTKRCILTAVRSYVFVPVVLNAINDTLIFLAISYYIGSYTIVGASWGARAKSFFRADGLPRLSKALLQGGQLYYL